MSDLTSELRQQTRASGLYIASRLMPGLATAVYTVLVIRWLAPESYAYFSLAWLGATVIANAATGWLRQAHLRFRFVSEPEWLRRTRLVSLGSLSGLALAAVLLTVLAPIPALIVGAALLAIQIGHHAIVLSRFQATEQPRPTVQIEVVRSAIPLALVAGIIYRTSIEPEYGAVIAILAMAFGYMASTATVRARPHYNERRAIPMRVAWRYGWPLSVWLAASLLNQYVDRAMLISLSSADTAGVYAASYDIAIRGTTIVLGPIALAAQPAYMRLRSADATPTARAVLRRALWAQLGLAVLSVMFFAATPETVFPLIGLDQGTTVAFFSVLLVSSAGWNAALLVQKPLEYSQRTRTLLASMLVALAANVVINAFLIPPLGAWGAAWATLVSTGLYVVTVWRLGRVDETKDRRG